MNSLILVKMKNVNYNEWKKLFDQDSEAQSKMMKNTIIGKIDDNSAMICTEVTNQDIVNEFMTSENFKKMEEDLGLTHEVYKLEKINN